MSNAAATDAPVASDFGRRLAGRVAARTGVRRHAGRHGAIGIVSRSAVGFGQAIGRSRQTRPNVTTQSLTSLRLRPPSGWWHTLGHPDAAMPHAEQPTPAGSTWTDDLVPPTRHTPRPARTPQPGRPAAAAAPAVATARPTEAPAALVAPTGLGRLDALRNMLAGGMAPDGSTVSPEILSQQRPDGDVPAEKVAPTTPRRAVPVLATADRDTEPAPRQAYTEAGPSTGPGALSRRMQPEPVVPGARPTPAHTPDTDASGRGPGTPSAAGSLRSAGPTAPPDAPSAAREPALGQRPANRSGTGRGAAPAATNNPSAARPPAIRRSPDEFTNTAQPDSRPSDSDRTRMPRNAAPPRAAIAPGEHPSPAARYDGDVAGTARADTAISRSTTRSDRPAPSDTTTPGTARADTAPSPSAATPDRATGPSTNVPPTARADIAPSRPTPTPDGGAREQISRLPAGDLPPSDRPAATSSEPTVAPGPPGLLAGRSATALVDQPLADRAAVTPPRPGGATAPATARRTDAAPTDPGVDARGPVLEAAPASGDVAVATAPKTDLRIQRLIAADPLHRPAPPAARLRPAVSDETSPVIAPAAAPSAPRDRPPLPRLPGQADGNHPVRRVTLPRAMSRAHRPASVLRRHAVRPPASNSSHTPSTEVAELADLPGAAATLPEVRPPVAIVADASTEQSPLDPQLVARSERVSVRVAGSPDAPATATGLVHTASPQPGGLARRRSSVTTGADVLRRVLTDHTDTQSQPSRSTAAALAARTSVAPPTHLDRDDHTQRPAARGDVTQPGRVDRTESTAANAPVTRAESAVARRHVTHAAGRQRSDSGAELAERFMTELSQAVLARPAPLPTTFRPLADQIAGRRAVALSTDAGSRRALRSVGKRAATVGDTIHLDASAQQLMAPSAGLTEVVAHELTHVAHPSPAPRFFDDIDESPEERRAEAVARAIHRAPVSPTNSTISAPFAPPRPSRPPRPAGPSGAPTIRRSPAEAGTVSADELAARLTGTAPHTRPPDVIRRKVEPTMTRSAPPIVPSSSGSNSAGIRNDSNDDTAGDDDWEFRDRKAEEWFRTQLERNHHLIVERLEETILTQLERRGGRYRGGF